MPLGFADVGLQIICAGELHGSHPHHALFASSCPHIHPPAYLIVSAHTSIHTQPSPISTQANLSLSLPLRASDPTSCAIRLALQLAQKLTQLARNCSALSNYSPPECKTSRIQHISQPHNEQGLNSPSPSTQIPAQKPTLSTPLSLAFLPDSTPPFQGRKKMEGEEESKGSSTLNPLRTPPKPPDPPKSKFLMDPYPCLPAPTQFTNKQTTTNKVGSRAHHSK